MALWIIGTVLLIGALILVYSAGRNNDDEGTEGSLCVMGGSAVYFRLADGLYRDAKRYI